MFDIDRFQAILDRMHRKLVSYGDISGATSPEEDWTIAELVSHLIDSAGNNHQRFIRLQLEPELIFPAYDAEQWRRASKARDIDYSLLVELWRLYNRYLIELIRRVDDGALAHCWIKDGARLSLEFLVEDYFDHLLWHEDLFDAIALRVRLSLPREDDQV